MSSIYVTGSYKEEVFSRDVNLFMSWYEEPVFNMPDAVNFVLLLFLVGES